MQNCNAQRLHKTQGPRTSRRGLSAQSARRAQQQCVEGGLLLREVALPVKALPGTCDDHERLDVRLQLPEVRTPRAFTIEAPGNRPVETMNVPAHACGVGLIYRGHFERDTGPRVFDSHVPNVVREAQQRHGLAASDALKAAAVVCETV